MAQVTSAGQITLFARIPRSKESVHAPPEELVVEDELELELVVEDEDEVELVVEDEDDVMPVLVELELLDEDVVVFPPAPSMMTLPPQAPPAATARASQERLDRSKKRILPPDGRGCPEPSMPSSCSKGGTAARCL
jgi:hypothetical protein